MKLNNHKPFNKVFMLGLYTAHVFFNPNSKPSNKQYPLTLHLYDNKLDKEVLVCYCEYVVQLCRHVKSYILEKYDENGVDYDKEFLNISIESMKDTLDMLCYDKTTEDEVAIQSNVFCGLEEDEFFNLVVKDENFTDFVKKTLQSDNKILEDKLSNLESLKNDVGVSYKSSKIKLFVGADNE